MIARPTFSLLLEYVDGNALDSSLPAPNTIVCHAYKIDILMQIADAVTALRGTETGIVHRSLFAASITRCQSDDVIKI